MNAYKVNLVNSVILIVIGIWGFLDVNDSFENIKLTPLISVGFGIVLLLCTSGIKKQNKVIAHVAVLLTLVVLLALFMPLKGAFGRDDSMAVLRILIMITGSGLAMVAFVRSFIAARKNKQQ